MLIPRNIQHAWAGPAKIINTYQPAGKIEEFFQVLAKFKDLPTRQQAIEKSYTAKQKDGLKQVFAAHGMIVTGPPLDIASNGKKEFLDLTISHSESAESEPIPKSQEH